MCVKRELLPVIITTISFKKCLSKKKSKNLKYKRRNTEERHDLIERLNSSSIFSWENGNESLFFWFESGKIENSELKWGLHGLKFKHPLCLLCNCYITTNLWLQRELTRSVLFSFAKRREKTAKCELLDCETLKYVCKTRSAELVPAKIFTVEKPRKQFYKANKNLGQIGAPALIMASDQSA